MMIFNSLIDSRSVITECVDMKTIYTLWLIAKIWTKFAIQSLRRACNLHDTVVNRTQHIYIFLWIISQKFPFYLLRADLNVVFLSKTAATAPHYRLRAPLFLTSVSLLHSPPRRDAWSYRLARSLARSNLRPFLAHRDTLFFILLTRSRDLHYTRGAQHTVPMTTCSLSTLTII